jgi:hypothetical protein
MPPARVWRPKADFGFSDECVRQVLDVLATVRGLPEIAVWVRDRNRPSHSMRAGPSSRYAPASHRTRQADPKPIRRELQWENHGRMPQPITAATFFPSMYQLMLAVVCVCFAVPKEFGYMHLRKLGLFLSYTKTSEPPAKF